MANTTKKVSCPACGKEMEKVFIPRTGFTLDICVNGCGGIFFDNREFKEFDEPFEDITPILEKVQGKTFDVVDTSAPRYCPNCGAKMVKNFASAKKEIEVDDCYKCGGKFLDNGELIKIRNQYESDEERSKALMEYINCTVGAELAELNAQVEEQRRNRSLLQKLFWGMIGDSSKI